MQVVALLSTAGLYTDAARLCQAHTLPPASLASVVESLAGRCCALSQARPGEAAQAWAWLQENRVCVT